MQLLEIINKSNKVNTIHEMIENIDLIIELVKDDVKVISRSKQIYFADFDYTFSISKFIIKKQLAKSHLTAIKRFYECKNIDDAIKWLASRLLNNMRNITTNKKYKLYMQPVFSELNENMVDSYDVYNKLELENLHKFNGSVIKKGLLEVWKDSKYEMDFDNQDFEELCKKFNIEVTDVIDEEELEQPKFSVVQDACCSKQLVMHF